jgi:DNA-binding PadR family transcriptional regulator
MAIMTATGDTSEGGRDWLNDFEQLVLLAVVRLEGDAYGMRIRHLIEDRAAREVPIASIYAALERLERRGCLESWLAEPTPERGGRAKKHFALTEQGADMLRQERSAFARMWDGIELQPETGNLVEGS